MKISRLLYFERVCLNSRLISQKIFSSVIVIASLCAHSYGVVWESFLSGKPLPTVFRSYEPPLVNSNFMLPACTPTALKFANINTSGLPTNGLVALVDSNNVKVADVYLTLPGTASTLYIRNSGTVLTTDTFAGSATVLANGFQRLTIDPVAGGQIDAGTISYSGISSLAWSGFNNFRGFTINYSGQVTNATLVQDTVGTYDFIDVIDPPSVLTPGTTYQSSARGTTGIKYVQDSPAFLIQYNTASISGSQVATIDMQKLDQGNQASYAYEKHDYTISMQGCVSTVAVAPNVTLSKSCTAPSTCTTAQQLPGTDLTYQIDYTNSGTAAAQSIVVIDPVPSNTDFKIGSMVTMPGTSGIVFAYSYSSDYNPANPSAATWTYTPVSGGGGASAGYDRNVKAVRWNPTSGTLTQTSPNNSGSVAFSVKIR